MRTSNIEWDDKRTALLYKIILYICGAIMAVITVYALSVSLVEYLETGRVVVGEVLVTSEFPIKGLAKPVSYLMLASVIGWYCVTRLGERVTSKNSRTSIALIELIAIAATVISLYELIYNFIVWNALITADLLRGTLDIDKLSMPYPNPNTPWSLVFATKMFLASLIISAHAWYLSAKAYNERGKRENNKDM
jgi:hypothetical protein